MSKETKTVFVGLSGGVDSSVAALRLLKAGYTVVGVFIKVWQPEWLRCNWEAERLDAMRVAAALGIPFLTFNAENEYRDDVAHYFIEEYKAGRTPNPDVMCNKHVKFGAFLQFALAHGADYVATGHYALCREVTESEHSSQSLQYTLERGKDTNKDQSYFLWTLTQKQLAHILLPLGNSTKPTIRQEALDAGLATASKKDSQGVCFLGHIDIAEFLSHYVALTPGEVLDQGGNRIGSHSGALLYTQGQRHGFTTHTMSSEQSPLFVVDRDLSNNTITVSPHKPDAAIGTILTLSETNLINFNPQIGDVVDIQTRYRQTPHTATVSAIENNALALTLNQVADSTSVGQSCVLYRGTQCLGGGIIQAVTAR